MSHYWSVMMAVAGRTLKRFFTTPALIAPALIFPMFFFVAFAGGLSNINNVPGFDYVLGYTAFQYVFVFLQSSAFAGVFTGFSMASDFERGFMMRLFSAAPRRSAIVLGYSLAALGRWTLTASLVTTAALLVGMQVGGDGVELAGLVGLGLLLNVAAGMYAYGIATRLRSLQAGPLMQTPVFLVLFLAPVYVPVDLLEGWIAWVAAYNPLTLLLQSGRSLLAGEAGDAGLAFVMAAALMALFAIWAMAGLRRAERQA